MPSPWTSLLLSSPSPLGFQSSPFPGANVLQLSPSLLVGDPKLDIQRHRDRGEGKGKGVFLVTSWGPCPLTAQRNSAMSVSSCFLVWCGPGPGDRKGKAANLWSRPPTVLLMSRPPILLPSDHPLLPLLVVPSLAHPILHPPLCSISDPIIVPGKPRKSLNLLFLFISITNEV